MSKSIELLSRIYSIFTGSYGSGLDSGGGKVLPHSYPSVSFAFFLVLLKLCTTAYHVHKNIKISNLIGKVKVMIAQHTAIYESQLHSSYNSRKPFLIE